MNAHVLGFPRIGENRELKWALERFWRGEIPESELLRTARELKERHWAVQASAGLDLVAVGDHSLYDHVLDTALMLDAVPARFQESKGLGGLEAYFAMARGHAGQGIAPLEMTKWFDSNYHYLVPLLEPGMAFQAKAERLLEDVRLAASLGHTPKTVLLGPFTFLLLSKARPGIDPWSRLDDLLAAYAELVSELAVESPWIQVDEPALCTDLPEQARAAFRAAYERLREAAGRARLLLATYFGGLGDNAPLALSLPVDAVHLDLVRGPGQLDQALELAGPDLALSLGLVDGRNIWRTNLDRAGRLLAKAENRLGAERVMAGSSCSLLHCPVNLDKETGLDPALKAWMAFAVQKCGEVAALSRGDRELFRANRQALEARANSPRVHDPEVAGRLQAVDQAMLTRSAPLAERARIQQARLRLPLLPTTTIGSFPQTAEIRQARLKHRKGELDQEAYLQAMRGQIKEVVRIQEELGLDVLVHGEPERNDMVEYFGQQMNGFCFTTGGWVQSYGSRCVKPPIIFGDVSRPGPMTVDWATYAQSLTQKPMKGMLTGPVTILCWSFVRDDLPRRHVCRQIALALRDEVLDLEAAGLAVIQIDEAALREGMPLRAALRDDYFGWAVDSFLLTSAGVADATQIHSHMCYSEFNAIMHWIARMDADVISIEASRSGMELLEAFDSERFPTQIGPGVYDIHSPRVPGTEEIAALLRKALRVVPAERLWVNPDCGLKTRAWPETLASLKNMVAAAHQVRSELS